MIIRYKHHRNAADWQLPLLLIAGVTLWRLAVAAAVPVTQDEAYYFDWARSLAWGYFDHPPGVALLGLGGRLEPASAFMARIGAVLAGALTLFLLWRLYRRSFRFDEAGAALALLMAAGTFPGLVVGVITTPDTVLALCWALALHEALAALEGRRARWVTAGVATGLGLLGKYTMVVIGPVFLWAILRADPKALRTPWPYFGAAAALLVFLPNILWNADNDWLTMRFQLGHGFAAETGALDLAAAGVPAATGPEAYAPGSSQPMTAASRLASLGSYVGIQAAFWGALLAVPIAGLFAGGGKGRRLPEVRRFLTSEARALLVAATVFPLVFFGAVALFSDVEANWSALYLAGAAPFAALLVRPFARWAVAAATANLLLVSLYGLHAATGALPLPDSAERIMRETAGYPALGAYVAALEPPVVFADRYPYAAMLNFYAPDLDVPQWPGITRPSEYSRGVIAPIPPLDALSQSGFWLVTGKFKAPQLPGFIPAETRTAIQCPDRPLQVVIEPAPPGIGCPTPLRVWRMYLYRPAR